LSSLRPTESMRTMSLLEAVYQNACLKDKRELLL
jgi:hypothetical protein